MSDTELGPLDQVAARAFEGYIVREATLFRTVLSPRVGLSRSPLTARLSTQYHPPE